jgi:integrase
MKYRLRIADPGAPEADQDGEVAPRRRGLPAKSGSLREGLLSFGAFPGVGLKAARANRDQALELRAAGKDPAREKRRQEAREQASVAAGFDVVATEFVAKREREGLAASMLTTYRLFQSKLRPEIGRYPTAEVTPADLLDALRKIEWTGALETASRTREFAERVFRYAVVTARAERDVAADLGGALTSPVVKGLPAVTDPKRVGEILRAVDGYQGQPSTMLAMKLAPLVFQRPGEVAGMRWDELNLDAATWRVPAGRKKERRDHIVPFRRRPSKSSSRRRQSRPAVRSCSPD